MLINVKRLPEENLGSSISAPSKMLRISSVAGIRQMPASTQKQPLASKLAVAVYYALSCAYLIVFAQITR